MGLCIPNLLFLTNDGISWCTQYSGRLGYAEVTNKPQITVTQRMKVVSHPRRVLCKSAVSQGISFLSCDSGILTTAMTLRTDDFQGCQGRERIRLENSYALLHSSDYK